MPLAISQIQAFACKGCSTIASVSVVNNKIKINKCRCVQWVLKLFYCQQQRIYSSKTRIKIKSEKAFYLYWSRFILDNSVVFRISNTLGQCNGLRCRLQFSRYVIQSLIKIRGVVILLFSNNTIPRKNCAANYNEMITVWRNTPLRLDNVSPLCHNIYIENSIEKQKGS